ncbi:MAG: hypothetical protein AAB361_02445 [Patescibacteria group bacterium]
MKDRLKKIIPIFIIVYCLIIVPIILYKYNIYLEKPNYSTWDQVKQYLINSKKYNDEPIIFNPSWLKNYATDYGRFREFNIAKSTDNLDNYWLILMDTKNIPENYQIIVMEKIKNLFIFKLKKIK